MSDLKELIEVTENVTTIDESKAFLQKLEQVCGDNHDYLESEIMANFCQYEIHLSVMSDARVHNTFSELTKSYVFAINKYLKGKRDGYEL